jgi:2-polyprenyl-6-methoxyphenol hydroxylase-like FAD-dependent oxidoreductase
MASHIHPGQSDDTDFYDVVIIGGALSGGPTATLLQRQNPGIRILILEEATKLSRRVGEATVEISAYFMGRVLGLTQYLGEIFGQ